MQTLSSFWNYSKTGVYTANRLICTSPTSPQLTCSLGSLPFPSSSRWGEQINNRQWQNLTDLGFWGNIQPRKVIQQPPHLKRTYNEHIFSGNLTATVASSTFSLPLLSNNHRAFCQRFSSHFGMLWQFFKWDIIMQMHKTRLILTFSLLSGADKPWSTQSSPQPSESQLWQVHYKVVMIVKLTGNDDTRWESIIWSLYEKVI